MMNFEEAIAFRRSIKQDRINSMLNFTPTTYVPRMIVVSSLSVSEIDAILVPGHKNEFEKLATLFALRTYMDGYSFNEMKVYFEKLTGYENPINEVVEYSQLSLRSIPKEIRDFYSSIKIPIPFGQEEYEYILSVMCFRLGLDRLIDVEMKMGPDIIEKKLPIFAVIGDQLLLNTNRYIIDDESEEFS